METPKQAVGRYFAVASAALVVVFALGAVLRTSFDIAGCALARPREGLFLGYCQTPGFGDYEHGAAFYDLEPEFIENVRRADVIFLGESKLQTAVSAPPVAAYFAAKGLRFFAFGFGFGETAPFSLMLLRRIGAHPKAVVINADGFFKPGVSDVAEMIGNEVRIGMWWSYWRKRLAQRLDAVLCSALPLCRTAPTARSWLRSTADGRWIWSDGDPDAIFRTITARRDRRYRPAELDAQAQAAAAAVDALALPRDCLILTGVPNPVTDAEEAARTLAAALDLPLASPEVDGLAVRDQTHLNATSAASWSAALVKSLDKLLDRCRAGSSGGI